jgi:hypothetical protein
MRLDDPFPAEELPRRLGEAILHMEAVLAAPVFSPVTRRDWSTAGPVRNRISGGNPRAAPGQGA